MGCHFLLQGNLPDPGIEPGSPALQADALPSESPGKPVLSLPKLPLYPLCPGGEFRHTSWYYLCDVDNFYKLLHVSELLFSSEILLERLKSDFKAMVFVLMGWRWRWISADSLSSQIPILHEAGSALASGEQTALVGFSRWGEGHLIIYCGTQTSLCQCVVSQAVTPRLLRTPSGLEKMNLFCKNSMLSIWCQAKEDDSACPLPLLRNNKICLPFYLKPE